MRIRYVDCALVKSAGRRMAELTLRDAGASKNVKCFEGVSFLTSQGSVKLVCISDDKSLLTLNCSGKTIEVRRGNAVDVSPAGEVEHVVRAAYRDRPVVGDSTQGFLVAGALMGAQCLRIDSDSYAGA